MQDSLRFRQIHLDFHTSPEIQNIGGAFNKQEWQDQLKRAHINSITCFSKCHHGLTYHDTRVGTRHPYMEGELLRRQFEACKEIDVNVPIYISAGYDEVVAYDNAAWREVTIDGRYLNGGADKATFRKLCLNSPYLDYLCDQIEEVAAMFPSCDGIFLDIISQNQCCCPWCLDYMYKEGLDPTKEEDRLRCDAASLKTYHEKTTAAAKAHDSGMRVFHNSGHIYKGKQAFYNKYYSHLELESLPTGGWGYDHFPESASYCRKMDHDFLGMTGKFHTTWGEFGGFKHPNALIYECAAMIAFGAKCSVGDQLHPEGKLDVTTYDIIGQAYDHVEKREAWCDQVTSVADIGLLSSESMQTGLHRASHADTGAARIFFESHYLFDILDAGMDFTPYKMLVLPDEIEVDEALKAKIDAYLAQGGKLLLSGTSGIDRETNTFLFDVGAECHGPSDLFPNYVMADEAVAPSFCRTPFVMYLQSQRITCTTGRSLGKVVDPYFNRSPRRFCSHQHTPNMPEASGFDCGVLNGNILYLAHSVFGMYKRFGAVLYKEYVQKAVDLLLGEDKTLNTNLPSDARVSFMEQKEQSRKVLHVLYAPKHKRGDTVALEGEHTMLTSKDVEVIEELMPLHDVHLELRESMPIQKITLEPQGKDLEFTVKGGVVSVHLDAFTCHAMLVLHY